MIFQYSKEIFLIMLLIPIAVIDYKKHVIPNKILLIGLGVRVVIYIIEAIIGFDGFLAIVKTDIIGALIIGGFFLACMLVSKNSIGMGDVKLFALMALYLGLQNALIAVFMSLLVSFFVSVALLITRKRGRKDAIAFGPSILLGTFIAIFISGI